MLLTLLPKLPTTPLLMHILKQIPLLTRQMIKLTRLSNANSHAKRAKRESPQTSMKSKRWSTQQANQDQRLPKSGLQRKQHRSVVQQLDPSAVEYGYEQWEGTWRLWFVHACENASSLYIDLSAPRREKICRASTSWMNDILGDGSKQRCGTS